MPRCWSGSFSTGLHIGCVENQRMLEGHLKSSITLQPQSACSPFFNLPDIAFNLFESETSINDKPNTNPEGRRVSSFGAE